MYAYDLLLPPGIKGLFLPVLKTHLYQLIVGNYTLYKKSDFFEIVNVITNFLGQPLSVKCDFWNGLNNRRYRHLIHLRSTQKFLITNFLPLHTLLIDTVQIFANTFHLSSKYSHEKRNLFIYIF